MGGTLAYQWRQNPRRNEHKASKSAPPSPIFPYSWNLNPFLTLPSRTPSTPFLYLPHLFLYLGWYHLCPAWGPGAPLHYRLHTDKSSEACSWSHLGMIECIFPLHKFKVLRFSFNQHLLWSWRDKILLFNGDVKSFKGEFIFMSKGIHLTCHSSKHVV